MAYKYIVPMKAAEGRQGSEEGKGRLTGILDVEEQLGGRKSLPLKTSKKAWRSLFTSMRYDAGKYSSNLMSLLWDRRTEPVHSNIRQKASRTLSMGLRHEEQHLIPGTISYSTMLSSSEEVMKRCDESGVIDMVHMDYCKAFCWVPHGRLVQKRAAQGTCVMGNWIQSWLIYWKHWGRVVSLMGKPEKHCISQESMLGALLW